MRKVREKSGNLIRLSDRQSFTIPYVQFDGLSFYQNALSVSQGNFLEGRESQGEVREDEGR